MKKVFCFELFESALSEKGLLPYHFTEKYGFKPGTITNMKKTKNIRKPELISAIEDITGKKYEDFLILKSDAKTGLNNVEAIEPQYDSGFHDHKKEWPLIGNTRGGEYLDVTTHSDYVGFAERWEIIPEGMNGVDPNGFCLRVIGDSMDPTLPAGSLVFVSPNTQAQNGDIALVITEGRLGRESCVKVIYNEENQIKLHSFNSQYADKFINKKYVIATYKVIGYRVTAEGIF